MECNANIPHRHKAAIFFVHSDYTHGMYRQTKHVHITNEKIPKK